MAANAEHGAPTAAEMEVARATTRALAAIAKPGRPLRLVPQNGEGPVATIEIPAAAVAIIQEVLAAMARGEAVSLVPTSAELTTQQAANMLGVSRPYVIGLIEDGKLPHRKVGSHRRIMLCDLLEFKRRSEAERRKVLDELTRESQSLGLGY